MKSVRANAVQAGLDDSKAYISIIKADKGETRRRPGRYPWRKFKRTHILIEVREKIDKMSNAGYKNKEGKIQKTKNRKTD